ncbi:hypothetical protein MJO52_06460 [Microbulbifer variabilis]|uniref:Uncharacterized protein n=1 Tax=Microbulbifer variabilis TaxID=266805 RepID=A0ABY4VFJ7_9GAMM|nr:hypothetical protein [Microbulbifer variabilis]USD22775.1 hypothetical protein MJO52_06460 [Microbulbifer variabilis]
MSKTTNYEVVPSPLLKRTYVFDWCEESQATLGVFGEQCFGIYRPPLYSYPTGTGFLVIYPLLLSHNEIAAGPLGLPVIPLGANDDLDSLKQKLYFRFRTYSESEKFKIEPRRLIVLNQAEKICAISKESEDKIGFVYTCTLDFHSANLEELRVSLELNDNSKIEISYKLSEFTSYRPVVAPNGPARDVEPFILIEGKDA